MHSQPESRNRSSKSAISSCAVSAGISPCTGWASRTTPASLAQQRERPGFMEDEEAERYQHERHRKMAVAPDRGTDLAVICQKMGDREPESRHHDEHDHDDGDP